MREILLFLGGMVAGGGCVVLCAWLIRRAANRERNRGEMALSQERGQYDYLQEQLRDSMMQVEQARQYRTTQQAYHEGYQEGRRSMRHQGWSGAVYK